MAVLRAERQSVPLIAVALATCALAGIVVAVRAPAAPLVGLAGAAALASVRWRSAVVLLLVVLPFSGVPVFMAGESGLVFRDALIVAPLYVAFACWACGQRGELLPPLGIALPALAVFAALVLLHVAFAPSLVVGAIGAKIWLAYIPMLAIGYRFVRSRSDFEQVMKLTALLGLIPATIALAEWFTATRYAPDGVWTNNFGPLHHLYGAWWAQVRGSGLAMPIGDHRFVVPRVPSTFTSSSQFYVFSVVACATGLSQALRTGQGRWFACAGVLALGMVASGQRQAWVVMPILVAASLLLAAPSRRRALIVVSIAAAAMVAAMIVVPASGAVLSALPEHARSTGVVAWNEMRTSVQSGLVGHGTGWDTQAALRYGGSASNRFVENWYAKAALELGLVGLAAVVVALASLHWRLFTSLRRIDAERRRAAVPLCVAMLAMTATLFKGPVLDLDPLNVYFWLLIGMLLAYTGQLAREPAPGRTAAAS